MAHSSTIVDVPVLVSRFPAWCHPQTKNLYGYSKQSCDRSLKSVSEKEVVSHNGMFAACGGLYSAWVYPGGEFEQIKIIADFYSAWVFIDDLIDNTTDMKVVSDLLENTRGWVAGIPQGKPGLDFMHRLFTHQSWHPDALQLTKKEMHLWLDCTRELRKIEADERVVSVEEYMTYRQTNAAMGMMYLVMVFAMPSMAEDFLKFNELRPEVIRNIFKYCGRSMGIVLDLYKMNADHAQLCEWMHIAHIIQRVSPTPITLQQAVDKSGELFHEYEDNLAVEYAAVAEFSPTLAKAMKDVHSGSIMWLKVMRGSRYVKQVETVQQVSTKSRVPPLAYFVRFFLPVLALFVFALKVYGRVAAKKFGWVV
ncbi:Fc.00g041840.m01.CDS01 [Cosmosporella sp. VM-42]